MKKPSLIPVKMAQLIKLVLGHARLAIEIVLVAAILITGKMYRHEQAQLALARAEHGKLADNLQQQITIRDNQIQILKRNGGKVEVRYVYIPVESPIIITHSTGTAGGVVNVIYKTKGLCLRPGFGISYGSYGFSPYLDIKGAYWSRYSGLVGASRNGVSLGVSRHLDDVLPFKALNIEAYVAYSVIRPSAYVPLTIGVRSNF